MDRIKSHPILGESKIQAALEFVFEGILYTGYEGDTIASALMANGIKVFRHTKKQKKPRGIYCAIGKCTECMLTVNGIPNIRACVTDLEDGMIIERQEGLGKWKRSE